MSPTSRSRKLPTPVSTAATADITVRFESDIVRCVRDSENRVIEGDPSEPSRVTDVWTFSRDVGSADPNWTLVATSTEH